MQAATLSSGSPSGQVTVDFRAARPEVIRALDREASVVPAFVLLTHDEWRAAIAPFTTGGPVLDGGWSGSRHFGPPGWSIWAQLASRSGDMIVGGRDSVGFPAVPVALPDAHLGFEPLASRATAPTTPLGRESAPQTNTACRPVISREGPIVCASSGCNECLHAATLTTWYSMISCMCRSRPGDG